MANKVKTQLVIEGKNQTDKAFKEVNSNLGGLTSQAKAAGAAIAGVISVAAFSSWIKGSIDAADAAKKSASATGLAVEEYTALEYAAKLAGVESGALNGALSKLNRTIAAAASGAEKPAAAFNALGIAIKGSDGALKSGDVILAEIADRFQEMPDGIQKSAMAMELFGKSGAALIPLLNGGSEGLKELRAEAEALGIVISEEMAAQAEVFNDNLTRLGAAGTGASNQISSELLPTLVDLSELMVDLNKNTEASSVIATTVGGALKILASIVIALGASFTVTGNKIAAAAAAAFEAAKGNFSQAAEIMREVAKDNDKVLADAATRIEGLWDGSGEAAAAAAEAQKLAEREMRNSVQQTVTDIEKSQKDILKATKDRIAEEKKALSTANSDLQNLKNDRLEIEKRYQEALAGLAGEEEASYGAAQSLKVSARNALKAGDIATAQSQAQAALKMIQDLAAAGENTYGFEGFINELKAIELAANDIEQTNAQSKIDAIKVSLEGLMEKAKKLENIQVSVIMNEATLQSVRDQIAALAAELSGTTITIGAQVQYDYSQPYTLQDPGPAPQGFATGGLIRGPGTGTSDSIPALLSNGEYVIRAAAVRRLGKGYLDLVNRGLPIPRFADGGMVETAMSIPGASPGRDLGRVDLNVGGETYSLLADGDQFDRLLKRTSRKFGRTAR